MIDDFYFGFNNFYIDDIFRCSFLSVCYIGDVGYWFANYDTWRIFTIYIDRDIDYSFYQTDIKEVR